MMISFQDLTLTIPAKGDLKKPLQVLKGVTGTVEPGKVLAIMGPSGAGKTSLLSVLLGNTDSSWTIGGSLLVNGAAEEVKRLRHIIGYVPQDDGKILFTACLTKC
jgi:ABC-type multidrug transport system ATPase subunit